MAIAGESVNVMVTGGGAYGEFDFNTAATIRDLLPCLLDRPGKRPIRIFRYPVNTPCTYTFSIGAMDEIWAGRALAIGETEPRSVDLAVHMGMRPSYPGYCFETRSRKEGYKHAGEDGEFFPSEIIRPGGVWAGLPEYLHSDFDMERVKSVVCSRLPGVDLKVSDNAGGYFCEFELWSSLANAYLKHQSRNAVFLHVPIDRSSEAIERGARVAVELIKAAVEQMDERAAH